MWEEVEPARKKDAEEEMEKRVKVAQKVAFGKSSSSKNPPVSPPAVQSSPPSPKSPVPPQDRLEEELSSAQQKLPSDEEQQLLIQPEQPAPVLPKGTIIELPTKKEKPKASAEKKAFEVVEKPQKDIFSAQPPIPFILEQLEKPMPCPSSSSSDKPYEIMELESGDLEIHVISKTKANELSTAPTHSDVANEPHKLIETEMTTQEVVQEKQGELAKSPKKEFATKEVATPQDLIDQESIQEKAIELVKSPQKEMFKEQRLLENQTQQAAASIEETTQQPQEWTFGEELLDQGYKSCIDDEGPFQIKNLLYLLKSERFLLLDTGMVSFDKDYLHC
ncbi:hypothetical protein L7F22_030469 [Adiantum nelumboides]|nr:hypothetical protein [Adiantum nelumboides]